MKYPPLFGPKVWDTMMTFALNYPDKPTEKQQETMSKWLQTTMELLPCTSCSIHASQYVIKFIPDVSSKDKLVEYIVTFHNYVNLSLGKTAYTVTEAKAAFFTRLSKDMKDLPQSMRVLKENTDRIKGMQAEIARYQSATTSSYNNQSYYFYTTIILGIVLGIFIIIAIIVGIKNKIKRRRLENELKIINEKKKIFLNHISTPSSLPSVSSSSSSSSSL